MERWYKVSKYSITPSVMDATRSTEQSLFYQTRDGQAEYREAKHSEWSDAFATWAEARAFIIKREARRVQECRHALKIAEANANDAVMLPEEAPHA